MQSTAIECKTLIQGNIYIFSPYALFSCKCFSFIVIHINLTPIKLSPSCYFSAFITFVAVPSDMMHRGFTIFEKTQVPVAFPLIFTVTTGSDLLSSTENKREPCDYFFFSRLSKPCTASLLPFSNQSRQYVMERE
jgi:hypothetical protein